MTRKFIRGAEPTGNTPLEKLWVYLAERFGEDEAEAAHLYFLEQQRIYESSRRQEIIRKRPKRPSKPAQ